MSCNLNVAQSSVTELLQRKVNYDSVKFSEFISDVISNDKFTNEFDNWCRKRLGDVLNINDESKVDEIVEAIRRYKNEEKPDVHYSADYSSDNSAASRYGYSDNNARELGVRVAIEFVKDGYNTILNTKHMTFDEFIKAKETQLGKPIAKKSMVASIVINGVKTVLARQLESRGISKEDVAVAIKTNDINTIENWVSAEDAMQTRNVLALYKEILADKTTFFDHIFKSQKLAKLRINDKEKFDSDVNFELEETLALPDEEDTADSDEDDGQPDDYLRQLNNHDGLTKNFFDNIDDSIKVYFDGLKRCKSGTTSQGKIDLDRDNAFGIALCMDAKECCNLIFSSTNKTSLEAMKKDIRFLADTVPGFAAFHKLADDMDADVDFAYRIYSNFGKAVMSKLETVVDGEEGRTRISNRYSDKTTALRFEYLNSLKSTSILSDTGNSLAIIADIKKSIEAYNTSITNAKNQTRISDKLLSLRESRERLIASKLAEALKRYYPTVEETTVWFYLKNAHNKNVVQNMQTLSNILNSTIEGANKTLANYNSRQALIEQAKTENKELDKAKKNKEFISRDLYNDVSELYAQEYVDNSAVSAAYKLANEFESYAPVKIELNSRNVEGNNSSDVINNSFISNLKQTLNSKTALVNYGKYKFQSRQYDLSNILVEHRDENNNIVNYGLFYQTESGEFKPTSYANRLLRSTLYNGANNRANNNNALYSKMSKGDYVASAFVNFFNVEEDFNVTEEGHKITFGNYFMRTPSDAPKNFVMIAPKYGVTETKFGANDGLFMFDPNQDIKSIVNGAISGLPVSTVEFNKDNVSPIRTSLNKLVSHATSESIKNIGISTRAIIEKNPSLNREVHVVCTFKEDDLETQYILKGTLIKDNGRYVLSNPVFDGFTNVAKTQTVSNALYKHYYNKFINDSTIKRNINLNHPIVKQFKNIFIQELTDAAVALNTIFECGPDGRVILEEVGKGKNKKYQPKFKAGFANDKASARRLYDVYHCRGNIIGSDGKLTGKVFTSDRFTVTDTVNGKVTPNNYGQTLLDNSFDFLYGGAKDNFIHFTNEANGVKVTLTEEQDEAVNEMLSEFISNYVRVNSERLQQFSNFIKDDRINDADSVAEFLLNYHLFYTGSNDLMEGNTKFYKDTQTFLKRAKECQAAGVPYGICNFEMDLSNGIINDIKESPLSQTTFVHKTADGKTENVNIKQRDKFVGVTIKNTVRTGETIGTFKYVDKDGHEVNKHAKGAIPKFDKIGVLSQKLIDTYVKSGMNKERATDKAARKMSGYEDTKVNDAQSYITFEEWVRRVTARGQFNKYKSLIEAVYDETKEIDNETLTQFIQVQKNFYYDQHYNSELGVVAPRQIKNAEFVLVPRFIKGTSLEDVYNLMKKHGIDQLNTAETSKAGKCNVLSLWDNNGKLTEENIKDFDNNIDGAKEVYNYNYLYTQQETPQHMNAENKAGIQVLKKMVDNIPLGHPLYDVKQQFFRVFTANIKESFTDLMNELNIPLDESGNVKLDENGLLEGVDFNKLFDKFKEEVENRGLDSNVMDYVTLLDDDMASSIFDAKKPDTLMPTFMSNISRTFENIAQSIFNNSITRQKLPGFHAAQITNVGFNKEQITKASSINRELKYHPNGEPYIEIMLSRNAFPFDQYNRDEKGNVISRKTDEELLTELKEAGADELIGYRIPTEGKQSVCVMKVVGLLDNAQGSTIVVPDDWVSQTGSDFDIDSVYGIQRSTYVNKKGKLQSIKYKKGDERTLYDWFNYINRNLKKEDKENTKIDVEDDIDEIIAENNEAFNIIQDAESKAFSNLDKNVRELVIKQNKQIDEYLKKHTLAKKEAYELRLNNLIDFCDEMLKVSKIEEDIEAIKNFKQTLKGIKDFINGNEVSDSIKKTIENAVNDRRETFNKLAEDHNLYSFEEFTKSRNDNNINSRDARNNEILNCFIKILKSDTSLDENLARSNFDKLTESRDKSLTENDIERRKNRSSYNFLDQADYQDDAMSGANLKAASVVRDTMCSVCNTVQPKIGSNYAQTIIYSSENYNIDDLKESFDDVREENNRGIVITHNTFGWTKNNLNTAGEILTSYSSQTTAHILDAIKEGAIPNENDFTFPVFKSFPDFGSDYDIAVPFLMQPGVTAIVNAYNENKSIYVSGNKNPIYTAFKQIAKQFLDSEGIDTKNIKRLDEYIKALKPYEHRLSQLFAIDDNKLTFEFSLNNTKNFVIDQNLLNKRLNSEGNTKDSNLFDLGIILTYSKLHSFATEIGKYARVCNPDKFGAKQTIFATNKVIDDINDIIMDKNYALYLGKEPKDAKDAEENGDNRKTILEAIYPDINGGLDFFMTHSNVEASAYPSLCAFLKYATCPSIKLNRMLFDTQDETFRNGVMQLGKAFSGKNGNSKITEKVYKDYENYILNSIYSKTEVAELPLCWDNGKPNVRVPSLEEEDANVYVRERRRIYGYSQSPDTKYLTSEKTYEEFQVNDINNVSEEEIKNFLTLSPAQKVFWIQNNFADSGVFKYLKVSLFNSAQYRKDKVGTQTVLFVEDTISIEDIYDEFNKAFHNTNPLVALTAFDLVKYAFVVEGFKMRRGAINKIIPNNILYNDTNIVEEIKAMMANETYSDNEELLNRYVRSHADRLHQIATHSVETANGQFAIKRYSFGLIKLSLFSESDKKLIEDYDIAILPQGEHELGKINEYVKLKFEKDTKLYKIIQKGTDIYCYPLAPLNETENDEWSVNPENNRGYYDEAFYKSIIDDMPINAQSEDIKSTISRATSEIANHRAPTIVTIKSNLAKPFSINDTHGETAGAFADIRKWTTEHFSNPLNKENYFVRSSALAKFITGYGPVNGSVQIINGKEYLITKVGLGNINKQLKHGSVSEKTLKYEPEGFKAIVNQAIALKQTSIDNIYQIAPIVRKFTQMENNEGEHIVDTNINTAQSTVTELEAVNIRHMSNRVVNEGDIEANRGLKRLAEKGILNTKDSIEQNKETILPITAEYIQSATASIIHDLQYFAKDENGDYLSVDNPKVIDMVRNNFMERERLLKALLDARAFVRNYSLLNELDIESEDESLRQDLNKIKKAISDLSTNIMIQKAEENFGKEYLANLSDNPLIQNHILSVFDGFHSTGFFDAWVNDLQETANPLIQIVTKEVMGDIRAKELMAKRDVAKFKKDLANIKAEAAKAGLSINWDNIIDENGKFTQEYNKAFVDKIEELRADINEAKQNFGEGSIEHLKAKFAYDKFKLNHVNQELEDAYYAEKLKLEYEMISKYPTIYSKYSTLVAKRKEILSHIVNGQLSDEYKNQLDDVRLEINNLTQPYIFNKAEGVFEQKHSVGEYENPTSEQILYSIESATALNKFIERTNKLNEAYFTYDSKYGFEDELEKNLKIIEAAEHRGPDGKPTRDVNELALNDEYLKAKAWMENNTRFKINDDIQEKLNAAYKVLREKKQGISTLRKIAKLRNAYDKEGNIDPSKLTPEDIKAIREEQLTNYNIREGQPFSDKSLINNAPKSGDVFKASFYTGMRSNGLKNQDYIKLVNDINNILKRHYNPATGILNTHEISIDELNKLDTLYDQIEVTDKTTNATNGQVVKKYIENNVDFVVNDELYREQSSLASQQGMRYYIAWQRVFQRIAIDENGNDVVVGNRLVFGYAIPRGYKPDGTGDNSMVDKAKTEALKTIREYTVTRPSKYYFDKLQEMRSKSEDEYNQWYHDNHVYDPYSYRYVPISCWMSHSIKEKEKNGKYVPSFGQTERRAKNGLDSKGKPDGSEDKTNHSYKKGTTASNYKMNGLQLPNNYDYLNLLDKTDYTNNDIKINEYEKKIRDLFQTTLRSYAKTNQANKYLDKGYMVSRAKGAKVDGKFIANEFAKYWGWINSATGKDAWYEDIDYATDKTIAMPMMTTLKSKDTISIENPPKQLENETDEDFNKRLEEYNTKKAEAEEKNRQIHKDLLDRNWESVMEDFMYKAAHFNAVQDNKYMLFYAKNMLDKLDVYVKNLGFNDLKKDYKNSNEDETTYIKKKDERLQDQYANWIRRLVYDQWKEPNNHWTRGANILQTLTSSKFMMLNFTGGIANITVGETQVFGEALAGEFFNFKQWAKGMGIWNNSVPNFLKDMYSDKSTSLPAAIVKFMNVVDFDENNGLVHIPDASEYVKRARDFNYAPQSSGEHFMQNSAMFSMLLSHRLVFNDDKDKNGKLTYEFKNEKEFVRGKEEDVLKSILNAELLDKWETFKKENLSDDNKKKEVAWFRRNLVTEFANLYLSNKEKLEFGRKRKEAINKAKEEFNDDIKYPTIYSQLELQDGMLGFKQDSILAELGDEAYQLLGRFKGRVISANKKIHGVYDRLGAAQIEKYWWGSLVMQYHKHLYPGIMKRWRRQGYFNEERGTIEKGCYASIKDFLSLPLHKQDYANKLKEQNGMTNEQLTMVQGIQNVIKAYVDFAVNVKANWAILSDVDKSNIKRAAGDLAGVFAALCLAIAVHAIADDDDENGLVYNLFIYEADRLSSESAMYNPLGMVSEGKKLWSSPVAATSGITDLIHTAGFISQYMLQGNEFNPYYTSGLYAGENKVVVNLRRQIPMYHGISMLTRLNKSNKYYKLDKNMLSIIPTEDIGNGIADMFN